jgi:hypothetical protein
MNAGLNVIFPLFLPPVSIQISFLQPKLLGRIFKKQKALAIPGCKLPAEEEEMNPTINRTVFQYFKSGLISDSHSGRRKHKRWSHSLISETELISKLTVRQIDGIGGWMRRNGA